MSNSPPGYRALTESVSHHLATLRADLPDVMKGFGDLAKAGIARMRSSPNLFSIQGYPPKKCGARRF